LSNVLSGDAAHAHHARARIAHPRGDARVQIAAITSEFRSDQKSGMRCKYLIYWRLPLTSYVGSKVIAQPVYRVDRSYSWNHGPSATLPRVRRVACGPGGRLVGPPPDSPARIRPGRLLTRSGGGAFSDR